MESNPELEFEYFLAAKLHMTVGQLQGMPNAEFVGWQVYYGRQAQQAQLANGGVG